MYICIHVLYMSNRLQFRTQQSATSTHAPATQLKHLRRQSFKTSQVLDEFAAEILGSNSVHSSPIPHTIIARSNGESRGRRGREIGDKGRDGRRESGWVKENNMQKAKSSPSDFSTTQKQRYKTESSLFETISQLRSTQVDYFSFLFSLFSFLFPLLPFLPLNCHLSDSGAGPHALSHTHIRNLSLSLSRSHSCTRAHTP